jgi:hypothetical protein
MKSRKFSRICFVCHGAIPPGESYKLHGWGADGKAYHPTCESGIAEAIRKQDEIDFEHRNER